MGGKSRKQSWSAAEIEHKIMKMRAKPRTIKKLTGSFGNKKNNTKETKETNE